MSPNKAIFSAFIVIFYFLFLLKKYIPEPIVYFVLLYLLFYFFLWALFY